MDRSPIHFYKPHYHYRFIKVWSSGVAHRAGSGVAARSAVQLELRAYTRSSLHPVLVFSVTNTNSVTATIFGSQEIEYVMLNAV